MLNIWLTAQSVGCFGRNAMIFALQENKVAIQKLEESWHLRDWIMLYWCGIAEKQSSNTSLLKEYDMFLQAKSYKIFQQWNTEYSM